MLTYARVRCRTCIPGMCTLLRVENAAARGTTTTTTQAIPKGKDTLVCSRKASDSSIFVLSLLLSSISTDGNSERRERLRDEDIGEASTARSESVLLSTLMFDHWNSRSPTPARRIGQVSAYKNTSTYIDHLWLNVLSTNMLSAMITCRRSI